MRKFWLIFSIIFVILAVFSNDCGVSAEPLTALEIRTATNEALNNDHQFQQYINERHDPLISHPLLLCKRNDRRADVNIADELWRYYSQNPQIKDKIQENQFNNIKSAVRDQVQSESVRNVLKTLAIKDNCTAIQLTYDFAYMRSKIREKYNAIDPLRKKLREDTLAAYHHPRSNAKYHLILSRPENQSHYLLFVECEIYMASQNDDERRDSLDRMKVLLFRHFFWAVVRTYMWSFARDPYGKIDGDAVDYYYNFAISHLELQYVSLLLYGVEYA